LCTALAKVSSLNSHCYNSFGVFDIPKGLPGLASDRCVSHPFFSRFSLELCLLHLSAGWNERTKR
jgi:hypothetical protein